MPEGKLKEILKEEEAKARRKSLIKVVSVGKISTKDIYAFKKQSKSKPLVINCFCLS